MPCAAPLVVAAYRFVALVAKEGWLWLKVNIRLTGFTPVELLVVIAIIGISIPLRPPRWLA